MTSVLEREPVVIEGLRTWLVVGMEVHVELATRSKMFTSAPNVAHPDHWDAAPNTLVDPVVVGMPGTLPVVNEAAVEMSMRVGLALGCKIARFTKWDRKSYYYPDLPKNYQISQYDLPLCYEGLVEFPVSDQPGAATAPIRITRAHLEEDAGKLLHDWPGGGAIDYSIVDLNRAGTPLLEIVTEPDITSSQQAVVFGQMLRQVCRYLGVSECVMQRGQIRFEPNINVIIEKDGQTYKTPIAEIKNLNSFKAVQGAIDYEHVRQVEAFLENGKTLADGGKSTRGWDDVRGQTVLQREKEEAHDYRYFPDPDLVPLKIGDAWVEQVRATLPELPHVREQRYTALGLKPADAQALVAEPSTAVLFDAVLSEGLEARRAAAMLLNYGAKLANERELPIGELGITAPQVQEIADMAAADKIGSSAAEKLFALCCDSNEGAQQLAEKHSLVQVSDTGELEIFVDQVLEQPSSAKAIEDIKAGKDKAAGMLIGQVMKLSRGKANPKVVSELIIKKVRG